MLTRVTFIITFMLTLSVMVFPAGADQPSITHDSPTQQKTQKTNDEEDNPDTVNRAATPTLSVHESYTAPDLQIERAKDSDQGDNPKNIRRRDFGLPSWLLAIFTGLLVVVGAVQAATLWHTLKLATKTKRPYVFLDDVKWEQERDKTIDDSKPHDKMPDNTKAVWKVLPYWKNSGDTSANVIISANCEIRWDKPSKFPYVPKTTESFKYECHSGAKGFIAPRARILNEPLLIRGRPDSFDDVIDGAAAHLFVWGEAKYDSILSKKILHHAHFCVEVHFRRTLVDGIDFFYTHCTDYNHAD